MSRVVIALVAVAVLAVGMVSVAFAQTPTPAQPGWGCWGAGGGNDPAANPTTQRLAEKMGIGAADLVKELQAGKSVAEVAKAKNVELQTLVDTLLEPHAAMLEVRVQYGYLTQEQADAMQKAMAERVKYQLEQKGYPGSGWGRGMMGGLGGAMGPGMMGGFGGGMMGPGMMGGFRGGPGGGSWGAPRLQGSGF